MTDRLINSAALYFRSDAPQRVPILWLTRAIDFFSSQGITLDYFDIDGDEAISSDDTWSFADYKDDLFKSVNEGLAESVGLYSNPNPNAPRSAWQAMASVEMVNGMTFLGIDDTMLSQHGLLLRSAYLIGGELLGVKYGISYKRLLAKGPSCYAAGVLLGSLADIKSWLSSEDEDRRRLTAWRDEGYGSRRYLTDLFRGAYPASIISCEHLAAILDRAHYGQVPGKITPLLENKLWMWELTSSEMIVAEKLIQDGLLLVE